MSHASRAAAWRVHFSCIQCAAVVLSVQPQLRFCIRKLQDCKAAKSFECPLKG